MNRKKSIKESVLENEADGMITYSMPEGMLFSEGLNEFVKRSAKDILVALNRAPKLALAFMDVDQRWINDYAMGQVIIRLKTTVDILKNENRHLRELIDNKGKA